MRERTGSPPCSRCQQTDRMARLPDTATDFGGLVSVWVCRRCGIVAIETQGKGRKLPGPGPGGKTRRAPPAVGGPPNRLALAAHLAPC